MQTNRLRPSTTAVERRHFALRLLVIVAIFGLVIVAPYLSRACTCDYVPTPEQSMFLRDAVFTGIVDSTSVDTCGYAITTMTVTRVWQGIDSCIVQVITPFNSCGIGGSVGSELLILADWVTGDTGWGEICSEEPVLFTWACYGGYNVDLWPEILDELPPPGQGVGMVLEDEWGSPGDQDGEFDNPSGIAVNGVGDVYVVDSGNHRIQRFTGDGVFISSWGSQGSADGQFMNPSRITIGPDETIYVTDTGNNRVQRFTAGGVFLGKWGTYGTGDGEFKLPLGVATDSAGNVYVTDETNLVQKFTSTGDWIKTWHVSNPVDIAVGGSDVYISTNVPLNDILRYTTEGELQSSYLTLCGSGGLIDWLDHGFCVDSNMRVYGITDNNYILKFTKDGTLMTGWWGQRPLAMATNNDGMLIAATGWDRVQVWGPRQVATAVDWRPHIDFNVLVYPNPFNPSVTIQFNVVKQAPVELIIYDVTGRRVRLFDLGARNAGPQTVNWHGRDDSGDHVSSGVYFAKVTQGGMSVSRKLVLLK